MQPKSILYILLHNSIITYPILQFVYSSGKIIGFKPCNDQPCVYTRQYASDHAPSCFGFLLVRNGVNVTSDDAANPTCKAHFQTLNLECGDTPEQTRELCATKEMKANVINHLHFSNTSICLLISFTLKGVLDVAHDALLLHSAHVLARRAAKAALVALGVAVTFAFHWGVGTTNLFVARNDAHNCVCYYTLPEVTAIAGILVPVSLLIHFFVRYTNHLKTLACGDYLFSWRGVVPFRVLQMNVRAGSIESHHDALLVNQVCGDRLGPEGECAELESWVPQWPSARELVHAIRIPMSQRPEPHLTCLGRVALIMLTLVNIVDMIGCAVGVLSDSRSVEAVSIAHTASMFTFLVFHALNVLLNVVTFWPRWTSEAFEILWNVGFLYHLFATTIAGAYGFLGISGYYIINTFLSACNFQPISHTVDAHQCIADSLQVLSWAAYVYALYKSFTIAGGRRRAALQTDVVGVAPVPLEDLQTGDNHVAARE